MRHGGDVGGPGWPKGLEVDANGNPVFVLAAESYAADLHPAAKMKLLLSEIERIDPSDDRDYAARARLRRAALAKNRYGTQGLDRWLGFWWNNEQPFANQLGEVELHTLGDDQALTLVGRRLSVVTLPDDENVLKILRSIEKDFPSSTLRAEGLYAAGVYLQGRNQFPLAIAEYEALKDRHPERDAAAQAQIEALMAPEAVLDSMQVQLLGEPVKVSLTHRNIERVRLRAQKLDLARFVQEIWSDIESDEEQKRYWRDPSNLSYELLHRQRDGQPQYLRSLRGDPIEFEASVDSDPTHRYRQTEALVPESIAGAPGCWIVQVHSADSLGNESRNIVMVQDLALVEKKFKDQNLYLLADARSGEPVAGAELQVLQYWQEWKQPVVPGGEGHTEYQHRLVEKTAGADGIALFDGPKNRSPHAMAMAALPDGRLAFSGVRYFSGYSASSRQSGVRALVFTDRPVYRPGHDVKVQVWMRDLVHGRYRDPAPQQRVAWSITNPKGEVLAKGQFDADELGGGHFEAKLPAKSDEPALGLYRIDIGGASYLGGNTFRVEEYRKPEFEVSVVAGEELARLGDEVTGHIEARYLFGAPVADAKVSYRIYREEYAHRFAAPGRWDWLYGPGYGWSYYDYGHYPWWERWGCVRFVPWVPWKPERELVSEGQGRLDADGRIEFSIDTSKALSDHPDQDHRYTVVAEVTDASRRTLSGEGQVIVTRQEFSAFVDLQRGWVTPGDEIPIQITSLTATGTPVASQGTLTLARVRHATDAGSAGTDEPVEVRRISTDAEGRYRTTPRAEASGQFLVRYETTDSQGRSVFGSAVLWVCGSDFDGRLYRMNDLEVLTDKRSYAPGETARVLINSERAGARILFASHTDNGVLLDYEVLALTGKSRQLEIPIEEGDTPNFFIEATTVFDGNVHQEVREVLVPPLQSELQVEVTATDEEVGPGESTRITVKTTTPDGKPIRAQVAVSVFDKAVLQIQPELTPPIRSFFWGDRMHHSFQMQSNLRMQFNPYGGKRDPRYHSPGGLPQDWDGGFGARWRNLQTGDTKETLRALGYVGGSVAYGAAPGSLVTHDMLATLEEAATARGARQEMAVAKKSRAQMNVAQAEIEATGQETAAVQVRRQFADAAHWAAGVDTTAAGVASIDVTFPENLTTWKVKTLGISEATRVGEADTAIITSKDFLVRLASPRFFTERDEVVLSAIVHNDLPTRKTARVTLTVPGDLLEVQSPPTVTVDVAAKGEARVDWTVAAKKAGLATIAVAAVSGQSSDAMEMAFPVLVHGFIKTVSFTGAIPATESAPDQITVDVPEDRRPEESLLTVRVSPSLGLAMLDALPYLIQYPYGCTEQTMSRFVPAVTTRQTLQRMGVNLADLDRPRTNLNAQKIGGHRFDSDDPNHPPVYSERELEKVIRSSLKRIAEMQRPDGGWGWWANDEPSTYLTAYVMWGLIQARDADVAPDASMLTRGFSALRSRMVTDLEHWKQSTSIGNTQAFVAYSLSLASDSERGDTAAYAELLDLLFERRQYLSRQSKALLSMALRHSRQIERADLVLRNARQQEQRDDENGTVSYPLDTQTWWYWWNNDVESHAWLLRAIVAKDPRDPALPGLVKWLLNNRRNGTHWRSTRDTAITLAAFGEYVQGSSEATPEMTIRVKWDGELLREIPVNGRNLFTFDNVISLRGRGLTSGAHTLTVEREGEGAVYWNAEVAYFTLEEHVKKAGLEIKVDRTYYRLVREDRTDMVPGSRNQRVAAQRVGYRRIPIEDGDRITSGDLLEVELNLTSKNDYDYLVFEDPKPAGCEPVEVRSGARWGELVSNMELRDEKVAFFVGWLSRGEHRIRYRLRAETPGVFHTLPTRAWAMYAPELKANSDELVFGVNDAAR
jgi:hypothetical protein